MDLQAYDRQSAFIDTAAPKSFMKDKTTQPGLWHFSIDLVYDLQGR